MTRSSESRSRSLAYRDANVLATAEKLRFFPLAPVQGSGARLIEEDGRELLDLSGSWGAGAVGYAHPNIVDAVTEAVGRMPGASVLSQTNPDAVALAEELTETLPDPGDRLVYLGLAGSDANAAALRCARAFTGRRGVLAFRGSYHGGLGPAQHVSGLQISNGLAADPDLALVEYPTDTLDGLRSELVAVLKSGTTAAVIVEPVLSDGGVIPPPTGFLGVVESACREYDVLLVCDEVKVGLGRTGVFHAHALDETNPDIITFGKALGGGLPLSAAVGRAEVMNAAPASSLLTTAGNPVSCAAGRAVLRTIRDDKLVGQSATLGAVLRDGLARIAEQHRSLVREVRGRGFIAALDLEPRSKFAARVAFRGYQLGVVTYCVGAQSNVLEFTPPFVISPDELREALTRIDQALTDVENGLVGEELLVDYQGWQA